jgi:hypothetical protein
VDLLYPAGSSVSVPPADEFAQIGEDLNNLSSSWHDRVLLPGGTEANVTVPLPTGHQATLTTEMDTEAYLTSIIGTALSVLAAMTGKLAQSASRIVSALAQGTCLRDLALTGQHTTLTSVTAQNLGAVAFECVNAAAKLGAAGIAATLAAIISSLAGEFLGSLWGLVDTATGNGYHVVSKRV